MQASSLTSRFASFLPSAAARFLFTVPFLLCSSVSLRLHSALAYTSSKPFLFALHAIIINSDHLLWLHRRPYPSTLPPSSSSLVTGFHVAGHQFSHTRPVHAVVSLFNLGLGSLPAAPQPSTPATIVTLASFSSPAQPQDSVHRCWRFSLPFNSPSSASTPAASARPSSSVSLSVSAPYSLSHASLLSLHTSTCRRCSAPPVSRSSSVSVHSCFCRRHAFQFVAVTLQASLAAAAIFSNQ